MYAVLFFAVIGQEKAFFRLMRRERKIVMESVWSRKSLRGGVKRNITKTGKTGLPVRGGEFRRKRR